MIKRVKAFFHRLKENKFLFEELTKRDFIKKYKRTTLGMLWSILGPLMTLGVMAMVFTQFFGRTTPYFIIYMFCGNLLFNFFRESTSTGMTSLYNNASTFSKINVPKYMFLLSRNVSAIINFAINLVVLFVFIPFNGLMFSWQYIFLLYPICCLIVYNLGVGLILSALYLMFRDIKYLYDIFTMLLMYLSAIFYNISAYPQEVQNLFYLNPIYVYIKYFRMIIIDGTIPPLWLHGIAAGYAFIMLAIGALIYKKKNYKFLYYI